MATKAKKSVKPSGALVDLKAVEDELNRDAGAQAAFIKNPGKFMEERGLKLRAKDKAELKGLAQELTSGPKLPSGSDLKAKATSITIVIRRRF